MYMYISTILHCTYICDLVQEIEVFSDLEGLQISEQDRRIVSSDNILLSALQFGKGQWIWLKILSYDLC